MLLFIAAIILLFAVLLGGGIVVFLHRLNQEKVIKILLAISGGFLLSLAFIHLIPEIYEEDIETMGYFVLLGFLIQLFLEFFSGGIEHGHIHVHKDEHSLKASVPWTLFIALSIHSFFEAMPLATQLTNADGVTSVLTGENSSALLIGIALHKTPVAIALMTLLLASGFKNSKAWLIVFLFGIMSPIGMYFGHFGAQTLGLNLEIVLAIVIGMFLHISTTIVFEASDEHKFNFIKLISILGGVGLALITI